MRVLLDTHVLLWSLGSPARLSSETHALLADPENEILFSAASIWEIAIKVSRGTRGLDADPAGVAAAADQTGFAELPVRSSMAARVASLHPHHRDPFDRLLVAQALELPAVLLTADRQLLPYTDLVRLVG